MDVQSKLSGHTASALSVSSERDEPADSRDELLLPSPGLARHLALICLSYPGLLGETLQKALHIFVVAAGRRQMGVVVERDQVLAVGPGAQLFDKA